MSRSPFTGFLILLASTGALAAFAPLEKTLGANSRLIFFHGAWVWGAMLAFLAAGLAGGVGLLTKNSRWHAWSQALGRSGLCFWIAFLPMSLLVMQANWNGLYLSEPRFRIPLNLAIVGCLLQIGLSFISEARWTSLGNLVYAIVFFIGMNGVQSVLHPDSPILNSSARNIQFFFGALLALICLAVVQLSLWWLQRAAKRSPL